MIINGDIEKAIQYFGFDINVMGNTYDQVVSTVRSWKKEAKKIYKQRAKELHPDVGGDVEKMQELNKMYEIIKILEIIQRQPIGIVRVYSEMWTGTASASTTGWYSAV